VGGKDRARVTRDMHVTPVMIVDDDAAIRATLRAVLEEEGYTVSEADDGRAGLELLRSSARAGSGAVVLLDLMMPVLDGAGVLRVVAAERAIADAYAFVLVTAAPNAPNPSLRELLARLDIAVLQKPFELEELLATVERAAGRVRRS
jgi:CheY-like chemotaxis protein